VKVSKKGKSYKDVNKEIPPLDKRKGKKIIIKPQRIRFSGYGGIH